jgi:hypothetical protein
MYILVATILIIPLVVIFTGCSQNISEETETGNTVSSIQPLNGAVQSNSGGAVTVNLEWLAKNVTDLTFEVVMDTHSVNLDPYDLGKLAILRDDTGKEFSPTSWLSPPGGHHRKGELTFAAPDPVKAKSAKYFEVVIRDVSGVKERVFKWQLN